VSTSEAQTGVGGAVSLLATPPVLVCRPCGPGLWFLLKLIIFHENFHQNFPRIYFQQYLPVYFIFGENLEQNYEQSA
jgi:hypothetical protein